jgi:hypothetical protein
MAIEITRLFHGVEVGGAYCRIERVSVVRVPSPGRFRAYCALDVYANEAAAHTINAHPIEQIAIDFDYDPAAPGDGAANVYARAYDAAKMLPEVVASPTLKDV